MRTTTRNRTVALRCRTPVRPIRWRLSNNMVHMGTAGVRTLGLHLTVAIVLRVPSNRTQPPRLGNSSSSSFRMRTLIMHMMMAAMVTWRTVYTILPSTRQTPTTCTQIRAHHR